MNYRIYLILLLVLSGDVWGYELGTHARITQQAYLRSVLEQDAALLADFGLDSYSQDEPFGKYYFDVSGNEIYIREFKKFTIEKKRMPADVDPLSIQGWLMRGAIREDDLAYLNDILQIRINDDESPKDDLYGNIMRVYNHFYDPINDKGLEFLTINGKKAPDWAIGSTDFKTTPNTPDTTRRNHFTIFDAREAQYRALSGHNKAGTKIIAPSGVDATEPQIRDAYWATMFRALGDVLHLVQDMSQPQHTRNDAHSPINPEDVQIYEKYINARALGASVECLGGTNTITPGKNLVYTGYSANGLIKKYGEFFDEPTGKGLANYSNANFFTAGTNFGNAKYVSPPSNTGSYQQRNVAVTNPPCLSTGFNNATVTLFERTVTDKLTNTSKVIPLTARGLWSLGISAVPEIARYTMTRQVYDAMADDLIPKAVGYSAELINYFFRPRIALIRDLSMPDTYRIRNYHKTETMDGKFELFYEDTEGVKRPIALYGANDLTKTPLTQISIPPDTDDPDDAESLSQLVAFDLPQNDPDIIDTPQMPKTNYKYTLVFRGKMGNEEDAVAGKEVCLPWDIGGGTFHALVIRCDHTLWTWGANDVEQLGSPGLSDNIIGVSVPIPVSEPLDPVQAALFREEKFDVLANGRFGATNFALATASGNVWAWGHNAWGQLGDGTLINRDRPFLVMGNVQAIATGPFTVILTNDGDVLNWGYGGEYGGGTLTAAAETLPVTAAPYYKHYSVTPIPVELPGPATAIATNGASSMAVVGGEVYVWGGENLWTRDQLGLVAPQRIPGLSSIIRISMAGCFALALDSSGMVWAMVDLLRISSSTRRVWILENGEREITEDMTFSCTLAGLGPNYLDVVREVVATVPGLGKVVEIETTGLASFALNDKGEVYVWGGNTFGEYGNGTMSSGSNCGAPPDMPVSDVSPGSCGFSKPRRVPGIGKIIKLFGGIQSVMALGEDGALWSWGVNAYGQLGIGGGLAFALNPVRVLPLQ